MLLKKVLCLSKNLFLNCFRYYIDFNDDFNFGMDNFDVIAKSIFLKQYHGQ